MTLLYIVLAVSRLLSDCSIRVPPYSILYILYPFLLVNLLGGIQREYYKGRRGSIRREDGDIGLWESMLY